MEIFKTRAALSGSLDELRKHGKTIGFVPTMGALHQGHLSLINIAREKSDIVVCSIFVNPTQFNDVADLERYPRPVDADIKKLQSADCDILFLPSVEEMYDGQEEWNIELGYLEQILEGASRPGHYQGVTQIVKKLFDVVRPDKAFFGQKDFQQVLVLRKMVELLNIPVELIMCPIVRENDGLALSSRNIHLSDLERQRALVLSATLNQVRHELHKKSLDALKQEAADFISSREGVELDYFEICDATTLKPVPAEGAESLVALVAAKVGNTRLIDNIILK